MASANRFEAFSEHLCEGVHNLDTGVIRAYLSNTTPDLAADAVKADLAEISAGNGYTAGGEDTLNATSRTGAVTSITATDITWTASGGTIGPFRWLVHYNDTPTSPADPLLFNWDYGSAITLQIGEQFVADYTTTQFTVG